MPHIQCAVTSCKISQYNKPPGVTFHSCPTSHEMRNRWLLLLKNKCSMLDWAKSKICSRHFQNKYFDSQRRLKDIAIPTIFTNDFLKANNLTSKSRIEKLISRQTQADLIIDVKSSVNKLREPPKSDSYINDDLKCKSDTPQEVQLWLLVKKQDHLIHRLMEQISQNRKQSGGLYRNIEESISSKKEMEQNVESLKYIVKCLQEKHATLEEQIEILTAVESR